MIYYTAHPDRSQDKNKPSSIYEFRSMMAYFYILIFVLFMIMAKEICNYNSHDDFIMNLVLDVHI